MFDRLYLLQRPHSPQRNGPEYVVGPAVAVFVTCTSGVVTGDPVHLQPWLFDSRLVFGGDAQCVLTVHDQDVVGGLSFGG